MHKGLTARFSTLIENDLFLVATFLDLFFNISAFEISKRDAVKSLLKSLIRNNEGSIDDQSSEPKPVSKRDNNYILYEEADSEPDQNTLDTLLEEYIKTARNSDLSALDFWRKYENMFPSLACLAKKYLSVQTSSAAVERMFSISGHIFRLKRRWLGYIFFSDLVFLKLNENYLSKNN